VFRRSWDLGLTLIGVALSTYLGVRSNYRYRKSQFTKTSKFITHWSWPKRNWMYLLGYYNTYYFVLRFANIFSRFGLVSKKCSIMRFTIINNRKERDFCYIPKSAWIVIKLNYVLMFKMVIVYIWNDQFSYFEIPTSISCVKLIFLIDKNIKNLQFKIKYVWQKLSIVIEHFFVLKKMASLIIRY
jgi:hypothetical protein